MKRQQPRLVKFALCAVCSAALMALFVSFFRLTSGHSEESKRHPSLRLAQGQPSTTAPPLFAKPIILAPGTLRIVGWHNCSNFRNALVAAKKNGKVVRARALSKTQYLKWVKSWLWDNVPAAKRAKHATSPSVWVSRTDGGPEDIVQWIGGKDNLLLAISK